MEKPILRHTDEGHDTEGKSSTSSPWASERTESCSGLPCPAPQPEPLPTPRDVPYCGPLKLFVDARDVTRGIIYSRMHIPVAHAGKMVLLYPKWMPAYHSPQNPIELLAGLEVRANEEPLDWRRDPVEVYAFHINVPNGAEGLEVCFQFVSPTSSSQGDVVVTTEMLLLQWGRVLLYPAGYYARQIKVEPSVRVPDNWSFATSLQEAGLDGSLCRFDPVPLDVLVDSPVMAGLHHRTVALGDGAVRIDLFAHNPDELAISEDQTQMHAAIASEADGLFGSRHFQRYHFLVALSDELGGGGVEHHQCAEIVVPPSYFAEWEANLPKRDVFAHEFTHSWNGKFRRGADSWTPSFEVPIRNSLMWLYEGQTQYWGEVLAGRAGLWPLNSALGSLAKVAATYELRPGGMWRSMADTTRDPVIAGRAPLPWPSWQRSEDYYAEGQLMWLAIDTLIRELTGDTRSLDDFAREFFGVADGRLTTCTYEKEDVVDTLSRIADFDWAKFLHDALHCRDVHTPLEGIERGGYRLIYRPYRNSFCKSFDALAEQFDMRFSLGLTMGKDGTIQEVMWGSPAFQAGLTSGALIQSVNGMEYSNGVLVDAIEHAADGGPLTLTVRARTQAKPRRVEVCYTGGHRFPHLEPIEGARRRLDEIYAAKGDR